jgi:hypothetical protein
VCCLCLSADVMKWSAVDVTGDVPIRRSAHSTALVDNRYLYVFGGWDGQEELGDLHMFDSGTCCCLLCGRVPPRRLCVNRPCCFQVRATIGFRPRSVSPGAPPRLFARVPHSVPCVQSWACGAVSLPVARRLYHGTSTTPSLWATCCTFSVAMTATRGGMTLSACISVSIFVIDVVCKRPCRRVHVEISTVFAASRTWYPIAFTTPDRPGVRASGSMCVLPGNRILVFGGYDGADFLQDLWILHTSTCLCARVCACAGLCLSLFALPQHHILEVQRRLPLQGQVHRLSHRTAPHIAGSASCHQSLTVAGARLVAAVEAPLVIAIASSGRWPAQATPPPLPATLCSSLVVATVRAASTTCSC